MTSEMITRYSYSVLPEGHPDADVYEITVEYEGNGLWSVRRCGRYLTRSGSWEWESRDRSFDEEYLSWARYSLDEARARARIHAPRVRVNGVTATELASRDAPQPPHVPQEAIPDLPGNAGEDPTPIGPQRGPQGNGGES